MEIKTIKYRLDYAEIFDREVNEALADGWILDKRYLSTPYRSDAYPMLIAEMVKDETPDLEIKIKYFDQEIEKIQKISVGDWIDLRVAERVELKAGEYKLLRLGVGMILPDGYEAIVAPRSSTPSKFGVLLSNSIGVIDNSYSGDEDEWRFPALAIRDTHIEKGDRICQFRIIKNMDPVDIVEVDHLNEISRGGIGSTGTK